MQTNTFPIAGPTDHPGVGQAARNARTMSLLRDRISRVAQTARPPRRSRKGAGSWPSHIPLGSL